MNITIDDKLWRFAFDKDVTLEVIGALLKANFNATSGTVHILLDDLVQYLFYIDMNNLCDRYRVETGLSYYFNGEGKLRSGELFSLINDNKDIFIMYKNIYNRSIIKINNLNNISNDRLCTNTEELINNVYNIDYKLTFSKAQFNRLFNTNTGIRKGLERHITYISLDFLIDKLNLDRESVIENLSLHNFSIKYIKVENN